MAKIIESQLRLSGGRQGRFLVIILIMFFLMGNPGAVQNINPARLELHGSQVKWRESKGRLNPLRDGRYRLEEGGYLEVR